jgi:hypothetical protein
LRENSTIVRSISSFLEVVRWARAPVASAARVY